MVGVTSPLHSLNSNGLLSAKRAGGRAFQSVLIPFPNQNSGCPVPSTTLRAGSLRFLERAGIKLSGATTVQASRSRNEISPEPSLSITGPARRHAAVTLEHY